MRRGDVVLVDWPFSGGGASKIRPALIVQNDRDNQRLTNTIVAMITSTTRRATEATQLLIDILTGEGKQTTQ
jgi:mRNA interferase MazF